MQDTYKKIAEGIQILGKEIKPNDIVIPIGLDGAILYHLLVCYYDKTNTQYTNFLENTCNLSSKTDTDTTKFENILIENKEKTIYVLDLRTVTGTLSTKLKQIAGENPFNYTVLFDSNYYADLRAFDNELSNKNRIIWLKKEEYETLNLDNITHEYIEKILAVTEIKNYLD